jgi:uncharacterized protein
VDLTLERPGEHHYIRSIDERGVRVGEVFITSSLLISADQLIENWPPADVAQLSQDHLKAVLTLKPEVVLFGTGAKQVFLPQDLMVSFYQAGIGFEVMTTQAACRTFNVLVAEGRKVVAALMLA